VHVEDAVCPGHHFNRRDRLFELLENSRCQTDSVWPRASGHAVFDADRGRIGHPASLSPPLVQTLAPGIALGASAVVLVRIELRVVE
jgi:hypothetical protein